ncbi:MAG: sulfatase [Verrucomicrobiales bacterium]|nr:sulfatase [Verrucomicrobiales bacterium]
MIFSRHVFTIACGLLLAGTPLHLQAEETKPNVLFLICDDLNCDMGLYGHPQVKTPNIDKLGERGVRFDNAHCQYPLCGPSRASFMTGLYPDQTQIRTNGIYIRETLPNVKTIPQFFRDHGYFATRIGKIYHYNVPKHIGTSGHDDPYSWNYTINPRGRDVTDESLIKSLRKNSFGGTLSWLAADGTDEEQTDGIAATEAIKQLEQSAKDKVPFFLAVGLFRPHTPYVAPKKYFDWYPLESIKIPEVPEDYDSSIPAPALSSIRRKKDQIQLEDKIIREVIQSYYASISFADAQAGRILDALDSSGLADNTIVIFTSDHGYHMGEHGHFQKTTLFENATHVPLVVAGPGVDAKGTACRTPVEMVDFYPTLTELAGLDTPDYVSGVSLVPALKDPTAPLREFAFTQYSSGYSIKGPRYRYTEWGDKGSELYDHQNDPREMKNLANSPDFRPLVKELSQKLAERISDAGKAPPGLTQLEPVKRRVPHGTTLLAPK